MQASKATVDQVLEAIADAILQCVMFQTEAEETGAKLKTLNTEPLLIAMKFLSDLASKKAQQWGEYDPNMQKEMTEACNDLQNCVQSISDEIKTISTNPISKDAKRNLLRSAKLLMQRTVFLLQVADLYDIRKIIRNAKDCKQKNDEMVACADVQAFPGVVKDYIFQSVALAKIVQVRINYIVDPLLKKKLEQPNAVLQADPETEIQLTAALLQGQGTISDAQRRDELHDNINFAIDEIILITKETSQTLFAGLDLDIPIDDEDEDSLPKGLGPMGAIFSEKVKAEAALEDLIKAVQTGDKATANAACKLIAEAIAGIGELDGGPNLRDAASRLAAAMRDLFNTTRDALANPNDPQAMNAFSQAVRAMQSAIAGIAEMGANSLVDPYTRDAEAVHAALAEVQRLLNAGNATAAAAACKGVASAVDGLLGDLDEDAKRRLREAAARLAEGVKELTSATTALSKNPKDAAALAAFERAFATIGDMTNLILEGVRPAEGEMSADDRLRMAAAKVVAALAGLAATSTDPFSNAQDKANAVKAVNTALQHQAALAKAIAAAKNNPELQRAMLDCADRLARAMQDLVNATKLVMQNPNDPEAQKALAAAIKALEQISLEAAALALSPDDQMLDANAEMACSLNQLKDAVAKGDRAGVENAMNDVTNALKRQLFLAKPLANSISDPAKKAQLLEACKNMANALNALKEALPAVLANPNDRAAMEKFNKAIADLLNAAAVLAGEAITGDVEQALIDESARVDNLLNLLDSALKQNKKADAAATAHVLERALQRLAVLTKLGALKKTDGSLQRSLLDISRELAEALTGLSENTQKANAGDSAARRAVDNSIKELSALNNKLLAGLISPYDAETRIKAAAEALCQLIDKLGPVNATSYGDLVAIADALAQQLLLAQLLADKCTDPDRKERILAAIAQGEKLLKELRAATAELTRNPDDRNLHRKIEGILQEIKKATRNLAAAVQSPPEEALVANGLALRTDLAKLLDAARKGEQPAAQQALDSALKRIGAQVSNARAAANNTSHPEIKKNLEEVATKLKALKPELKAAGAAAIANPRDSKAQAELQRVAKLVNDENTKAMDAGKRVIAKEQPPAVAKANVASVTTVQGAAEVLEEATRDLSVDDSPLGKLYGASQLIGLEMAKLSAAAARGDKKEMIRAARALSAATVDMHKFAAAVAQGCRDPETRDYLISMALAAKNFGVQLKILCAVKASSEGLDKTTEGQLITCAKGLTHAVIEAINYAEIAELKK